MALGTPESVPAGLYGKETLEALKIWDKVESKLVYGKDVRQVLSYVETGNVDAGIVKDTKHHEEAKAFYDYLQSDDTKKILEEYGFKVN